MSSQQKPIRVAITGGGLAGAALIRGLLIHPHLHVEIFESAAQFSERGAAVGIGTNGLRALSMMGPPGDSLRGCMERAQGVPNNGNIFLVGSGPAAGTRLFEMSSKSGPEENLEIIVHRAQLLAELLREVPPDRMHVNKKLTNVAKEPDRLVLHFADDSTAATDILIGADGIHGIVRSFVLGPDHPATAPVFSGFWDCRNLFSYEEAIKIFGSQYINKANSRQHDWVGSEGFFIHDIIDDGKLVAVACAAPTDESWPADEWKKPLVRSELESRFGSWFNGPQIVNAIMAQESPTKFSEWIHRDASTYVTENIAIMGDAAHAMVPFQASGATQSLEDAMILCTVLGAAAGPSDIPAALKAYDAVRRERSQSVASSSLNTAYIACGKDPEIGLDPEKLRDGLKDRWNFILDFDLKKHRNEALQIMQAEIQHKKMISTGPLTS